LEEKARAHVERLLEQPPRSFLDDEEAELVQAIIDR
jgi:hypothetical protein